MNTIDQSVHLFFQSIQSSGLTVGFYTFTWFFNTVPAICLFLLVSFFLYRWSTKKSLIEFWGALVITDILVWIVKMWGDVPRPDFGIITAYGPSFPSAHTAVAATFCLFFLRYMRHTKDKMRRYIHRAFCILTPLMVGMSRLYLGVHWFSDVVVGLAIGVGGLLISDYIWKKLHNHGYFQG